jgi:hypothetical protein
MSKLASRLATHMDSMTLGNYESQAQRILGHWKFLVGYSPFQPTGFTRPASQTLTNISAIEK